jgi:hypothetical protein
MSGEAYAEPDPETEIMLLRVSSFPGVVGLIVLEKP